MQQKFTSQNPDFRQDILEKLEKQTFMHHIGFNLSVIEAGYIEGTMPLLEHIKQQTGFIHGGATATFADLVMGFAAYSLVPIHQIVFTADLRVSYLNPGVGDSVHARGYVIKPGNKLIFCEGEIYTRKGKSEILIATSSATMAVVNKAELKKI